MKNNIKRLIALITAVIISVTVLSVSAFADSSAINELSAAMREGAMKRESMIFVTEIANKYGWDKNELLSAASEAYLVCPELFFTGNAIRAGVIGNKYHVDLEYVMSESEYNVAKEKLDAAVKKVVAGITSDMTDLEKALYVHDYLILNCKYDYTRTKHDIYDCLVDKKAVCQGYSLAYMYILKNYLNIDCTFVYSDSMAHSWNYVKIGNNWYHVDVTNDDASTTYQNTSYDNLGYALHEYFMMSDDLAGKVTKKHYDWKVVGDYPAATDKSYDNLPWRYSNSPLVLSGKTGYYTIGNENTKAAEICQFNFADNTSKTLVRIKNKWNSVRNTDGTEYYKYGTRSYHNIWMSLAYRNGKLYFNTNQSVYSYDIANKVVRKIYTLSKDNKQIFGLMFTSANNLRLAYREDITYPENYLTLKLK